MNASFEFATATRIVFGPGVVKTIASLAGPFGQKALLVTGRHKSRSQVVSERLQAAGIDVSGYAVTGEPTLSTITEGVEQARQQQCDFVIAFGGGSAIDAGKAIAAMLANPGVLLDYLEVIGKGKALPNIPAPFIAVPTTAGTGSEVTRNSVLASPEQRVKVSIRSASMLPRVAVVDPELTYDLPPAVTASTGLDALTQLIEPYTSIRANPLTDALCLEGIQRVARSLSVAFFDGKSVSARTDMSVASLFGGLALANAGLGVVHGFAGPIGGMFSAPHGAICAALLPHAMEINLRALRQRAPQSDVLLRYQTVARLLTSDPAAKGDDGVVWVRDLVQTLKIPNLNVYGITGSATKELVENAAKASSMKANPLVLTHDELAELLTRAL